MSVDFKLAVIVSVALLTIGYVFLRSTGRLEPISKLSRFEQELDQLRRSNEALKKDNLALHTAIGAVSGELADTNARVRVVEDELAKVKSERDQLRAQNHQLQQMNDALAEQLVGRLKWNVNEPSGLRNVLTQRFNMDELKGLAFDIGVSWDDLKGESAPAKAIELIGACNRRGMTDKLIEAVRKSRPEVAI